MAKTQNPDTSAAVKGKQVSATVEPEFFEVLEAHRWNVRKKMSEVVREALDDYAAKHGLNVENVPTPEA